MGWQPPSNVECRVEFYAGKGRAKKGTRAGAEAEILTDATRVALSLMPSKGISQDSFANKVGSGYGQKQDDRILLRRLLHSMLLTRIVN